jgi:hypothetical protein
MGEKDSVTFQSYPVAVDFATDLRDILGSVIKAPYTSEMDEITLEGMVCSKGWRVPILRLHGPDFDAVCAYNFHYMNVTIVAKTSVMEFVDDDIEWDTTDCSSNQAAKWSRGKHSQNSKEFSVNIWGSANIVNARLYSFLRHLRRQF